MKNKKTVFDLNKKELRELDKEFSSTPAGKGINTCIFAIFFIPIFLKLTEFIIDTVEVLVTHSGEEPGFTFMETVVCIVLMFSSVLVRMGFEIYYYSKKR